MPRETPMRGIMRGLTRSSSVAGKRVGFESRSEWTMQLRVATPLNLVYALDAHPDAPMQTLVDEFFRRYRSQWSAKDYCLCCDGEMVGSRATPSELGLEDGCQLDLVPYPQVTLRTRRTRRCLGSHATLACATTAVAPFSSPSVPARSPQWHWKAHAPSASIPYPDVLAPLLEALGGDAAARIQHCLKPAVPPCHVRLR